MKIRLYHFSKRNKSTKQPGVSDSYEEVDMVLKDSTDVTRPTFLVQTQVGYVWNSVSCPCFW